MRVLRLRSQCWAAHSRRAAPLHAASLYFASWGSWASNADAERRRRRWRSLLWFCDDLWTQLLTKSTDWRLVAKHIQRRAPLPINIDSQQREDSKRHKRRESSFERLECLSRTKRTIDLGAVNFALGKISRRLREGQCFEGRNVTFRSEKQAHFCHENTTHHNCNQHTRSFN